MQRLGLGEINSTLNAPTSAGVHVIMTGQSPEFMNDVQVIAGSRRVVRDLLVTK